MMEITLSQEDFDQFAKLSGDNNPIHVDREFAERTRFGRTVSHGMLLFTVARGALENALPGHQLISQSLMFPSPCFADEALACTIKIEAAENKLMRAHVCIAKKVGGTVVLEGTAHLSPPGSPASSK